MTRYRSYFLYCIVLILIVSCSQDVDHLAICNKDDITSPYLITVKDAHHELASDKNLKFIHIGEPKDFNREHIPNAINLWRPDFRSKAKSDIKGLICSKIELEELLSSIGVDSTSSLLVYDDKGSVDAFRFTWVLGYYGFQNHMVINGGLKSWKKADYPTTSDSSKINKPTEFRIRALSNKSIMATLEDVREAIDDPNSIIVDTRETYEYLGQPFISKNKVHRFKKGAFTSGCIPNAVHLNWSTLADLWGDHRIKCKKDLEFDLSQKGITPDKNVIVYCQSGSRSSHTAFVLRHILNYPNVKNYDGSWIEWSNEYMHNKSVTIEQKTTQSSVEEMVSVLEQKLKKEQ